MHITIYCVYISDQLLLIYLIERITFPNVYQCIIGVISVQVRRQTCI